MDIQDSICNCFAAIPSHPLGKMDPGDIFFSFDGNTKFKYFDFTDVFWVRTQVEFYLNLIVTQAGWGTQSHVPGHQQFVSSGLELFSQMGF